MSPESFYDSSLAVSPSSTTCDEEFSCVICSSICRDPIQLLPSSRPCGHYSCRSCILSALHCSSVCPECRAPILPSDIQPYPQLQRRISQIRVKCLNHPGGCEWQGEFGIEGSNLKKHFSSCDYAPGECIYKQQGCEEKMPKGKIKQHQIICDYRLVACKEEGNKDNTSGCAISFSWIHLPAHRLQCSSVLIACPQSCGDHIPRGTLSQHIKEHCVQTLIPCEFRFFGCEELVKRGCDGQEEHNKEFVSNHLTLMMRRELRTTEAIQSMGTINSSVLPVTHAAATAASSLKLNHSHSDDSVSSSSLSSPTESKSLLLQLYSVREALHDSLQREQKLSTELQTLQNSFTSLCVSLPGCELCSTPHGSTPYQSHELCCVKTFYTTRRSTMIDCIFDEHGEEKGKFEYNEIIYEIRRIWLKGTEMVQFFYVPHGEIRYAPMEMQLAGETIRILRNQ